MVMAQKWTRGRCHCMVETCFLGWGILPNVSRSMLLYPASFGYSAIVSVVIHRLAGWIEHGIRLEYESEGMKTGGIHVTCSES